MVETGFLYCLLLVFPAAMAYAAAMDLVTMTIPNRISIFLIAAFLVAAAVVAMPLPTFAMHLLLGLIMLFVGMGMFAANLLGGGDAKLLAAASLWIGFEQLTDYIVYVGIIGGLLSVAIIVYRMWTPPMWLIRQDWALRLHSKTCGIPYGIAIGGAGLLVFPSTDWFAAAIGV